MLDSLHSLTSTNFKDIAPSSDTPEDAKNILLSKYKACIKSEKEKIDLSRFAGINWGMALSFMSLNGQPSITDAKVIDGVVRINKEHSRYVAFMLETHYFIQQPNWNAHWGREVGVGPFVAIRLADINGANTASNIGAYGVGLMIGFRDAQPKTGSWNIGAGYFVDTQVKEAPNKYLRKAEAQLTNPVC